MPKAYHVSYQVADRSGLKILYVDSEEEALEECLTDLLEEEGITSVEEAKERLRPLKIQVKEL